MIHQCAESVCKPSTQYQLKFRIWAFQLDASVLSSELPVDLGLPVVAIPFPSVDLLAHDGEVGDASIQALAAESAQLDFGDIEPTAVLGGVVDLEALGQRPGLLRRVGLVQRLDPVCVQVIHDEHDALGLWIAFPEHAADSAGPILARAPFAGLGVAPAGQRLHFQEDLRDSVPHVFVLPALGLAGPGWDLVADFPDQLLVGLVHAEDGPARCVRPGIDFQHVLHAGHECGIAPWRDPPVLLQVRLEFRFFKIRWTVMGDTVGARPSSTAFSASRRTVQRRRPCGADEQASAIKRASNAPSNVTSRGLRWRGLRRSAASSPSSTKRRLMCSIVRDVTPRASAVLATVQPGPAGPRSQSSSARAFRNSLPDVLLVRVSESSSSRSSVSSVTRYLGAMETPSRGLHEYITIYENLYGT